MCTPASRDSLSGMRQLVDEAERAQRAAFGGWVLDCQLATGCKRRARPERVAGNMALS